MLPLKLTIEGLYSYQTKQTIDFSELTSAGLFGIFGAVGSGKSSILEAVSFALYGETERMNKTDGRAYNMMNLRSNRSYIEFDFLNYENRKFRAVREFRRNSKRFDDVKVYNTCFYEEKNGEWIPLEHTNASEILGLSYENFKRTIIIPQGQFKEFLELGAADRTKMMKEIFSLHRFDLQDKVSVLSKKNELAIAEINGKIGGYEDVSETIIDENHQKFLTDKVAFLEIEKQYKIIDEEFQKLKVLKADFETLDQKRNQLKSFSEKEKDFKEKEIQLELFEKAERNFKALFDEERRLRTESVNLANELSKESEELDSLKQKLNQLQESFNQLKPLFENLETSKQKAFDLGFITKIIEAKKETETLSLRIEKGKMAINDSKINEETVSKNFENLSQDYQQLRSQKKDTNILMQVGEWFSAKKSLNEKQVEFQKKTDSITNEIDSLNQKLSEISTRSQEEIEKEILSLNHIKSELQNEKNQLQVSEKLSQFANELETGKPCPLCGALDHPNGAEIHNLTGELAELEIKINTNESQIKTFEKQIQDIKSLSEQKLFFENQKKENDILISDVAENLEKHSSDFIWKDFDKENFQNFEDQRRSSIELEKQISDSEKLLDEERKKLELQKKETLRFEDAIKEFSDKLLKLETSEDHYKSQINSLNFDDYKDSEIEILHSELENLNLQNHKTEQNYKLLNDEIFIETPKVSAKENSVKTLEKRKAESEEATKVLSEKMIDELRNHQFESIEFVKGILNQNLDINKERKEIQDFNLELKILKNDIKNLEEKLKDIIFSEEIYSQKQHELEDLNSVKNEKQKLLNILENEIIRLKKLFEEKKKLLKEQSGLQKRGENLSTILNLFRGNGFVQYVSSIYLKQLSDNANIRFHRMTRNQLSLQVNDRNEFEIIDYLNEGKTRSVKTLSGGQSFQVSLSLALALAESVQSQAVSDRNFFFIDEGFGTQDPESVNLVFETLNNLRNENRIVGIISHVEELKEKIPISLNITKDEETGSNIEVVVS